MSGHSKWSSIKHKKGAADAKRGKLFSKLSRAIDRRGARGRRPTRTATSRCRTRSRRRASYSMPKDNIERAIAARRRRRTGRGDVRARSSYEGYAPERRGRRSSRRSPTTATAPPPTFAHVFTTQRRLARRRPGAVAWLFERQGRRARPADGVDEDELTLAAAEGGAEDVAVRRLELARSPPRRRICHAVRERDRGRRHARSRSRRADDGPEDDGRASRTRPRPRRSCA